MSDASNSSEILLVTLNATYQHTAFGLRYLYANLREFQRCARIVEFTIAQDERWIVEQILSHRPRVVGFGIYIWNTRETETVISVLKKVAPEITIVIGGPEVSHETQSQSLVQRVDHVILGEADFLFYNFCKSYFTSEVRVDLIPKIIQGPLPEIKDIQLPYEFYSIEDISHRVIYVEASRGCPYKCEYCLSSLDKSVRVFDLENFLGSMARLIDNGVRQFKFVDRTFNLHIEASLRILNFFLTHLKKGLFLHFELVPDRLPIELRDVIRKFPPGSLQFEIGIQTWSELVAKNVSRRQNYEKIRENLKFLKDHTHVHTHADLIVGLPGETLESFAKGFDELLSLHPGEVQVGHLKRLKGTPITRHDQVYKMIYEEFPPFQIVSNRDLDFSTLQRLSRFSKHWDLIANSGNFPSTMQWLKEQLTSTSFFWFFYDFSEQLHQRHPQSHGIALLKLTESLWTLLPVFFLEHREKIRSLLVKDYAELVKREVPRFLMVHEAGSRIQSQQSKLKTFTPKRQRKHHSSDQSMGV